MAGEMSRPLKLLHINPGNLYGGVESVLVNLARAQALCPELETQFAVLYPGRLHDELKAAAGTVYSLGPARLSRPWTVWRVRHRLRQLLRTHQFDAVACHQTWVQAIFGPVVQRSESGYLGYFHGPVTLSWIDRQAGRTLPDALVAPSAFTLSTARSLFPQVPGHVVYNPLSNPSTSRALPASEGRMQLRKQLAAGPDDVVILQACRMESWKGADIVLQALAGIKDLPQWKFYLAGGPQKPGEFEYHNLLVELAQRLGISERVHFLGQRTDVQQLMHAADIYTQGNRGPEGFSISFVEACQASLPIVTTRMGGALEIVDESTGFLTEPGEINAFALALRTLIEQPQQRLSMGSAAHHKVTRLCDPQQKLQELHAIVYDVTSRRQQRTSAGKVLAR